VSLVSLKVVNDKSVVIDLGGDVLKCFEVVVVESNLFVVGGDEGSQEYLKSWIRLGGQ